MRVSATLIDKSAQSATIWLDGESLPEGTDKITVFSSATGDQELVLRPSRSTAKGPWPLVIPLDRIGHDQLEVVVRVYGATALDTAGAAFWFVLVGDELRPLTFEEHSKRSFDTPSAAPLDELLQAPAGLRNIDPRLNPQLHPEDRALAEAVLGPTKGELGVVTGALSSEPTDVSRETGCAGSGVGFWLLLGVPLALVTRRRAALGLMCAAGGLIAGTTDTHAKTVYGYVAFWDTREFMVDGTGSKLPTCDSLDTTCGPADGLDCCYRPLPNIRVTISQSGVILADTEANLNGFFILTGFQGDDATSYEIYVRYERQGDPGATRLIWNDFSTTTPYAYRVLKLTIPDATTYFPRLKVNSAGDLTGAGGNIASIWTAVADAEWGLADEGDSRYRRVFGAPSNGADDIITVFYTSKDTYDCVNSRILVSAANSRTLIPAKLLGGMYHGRVVGCAAESYDSGFRNYAKFPPNPDVRGMASSGSEGIAHHLAYQDLTAMISRWNPGNTSRWRISAAPWNYACVTDNATNSNDAAWLRNTTLAMWDLIDADATGADSGLADDVNIRMREVMDGLVSLSQWPGNPGDNASGVEAIYTPYAPERPCSDDQACNSGDACLAIVSANNSKCYGGDPHGSNIYDLSAHLFLQDAMYNWTGGGDFLETLESSPCVRGEDNLPDFTGGYRGD